MLEGIIKSAVKVFGSHNERKIKRLREEVETLFDELRGPDAER